MIVYGDQSIEVELGDFVAGLRRRIKNGSADLEEARVRLVLAGQLEQAAEDEHLEGVAHCRALTAAAAEEFIRLCDGDSSCTYFAKRMCEVLDAIELSRVPGPLRIKTPEGFAWYALFPDAYAQAAAGWADDLPRGARVLVIGIRSIGTTLTATVAATLKSRGFRVNSLTVRPYGHPFRRITTLPTDVPPADRVLVVDEGPGLSGSSMSSVAEALVSRGFASEVLTFFPGHPHGPRAEASAAARNWWEKIKSRCIVWGNLRWGSQPAAATLTELAEQLLEEPCPDALEDVGAGRWRAHVDAAAAAAPAIAPFLEQPKLLVRGPSNARVLFRFAGCALAPPQSSRRLLTMGETQRARLAQLSDRGLTIRPLASAHGWIALPWIEGRRLSASDASGECIERIGAYIRDAAGPPLTAAEAKRAFERLSGMLIANTEALLGAAAARSAARASDNHASWICEHDVPSYGDGRLAPHEWVRTSTGIMKLDAGGHDNDHTAIGRQPIWWDMAGACIEWNLSAAAAGLLAQLPGVRDGLHTTYFRAAYASFRAAVAQFAADAAVAPDRPNFEAAVRYYKRHLAAALVRLEQ